MKDKPTIWQTECDWIAATSRDDLFECLRDDWGHDGDAEAREEANGATRLDPDSLLTVWLEEEAGPVPEGVAVTPKPGATESSDFRWQAEAPCSVWASWAIARAPKPGADRVVASTEY